MDLEELWRYRDLIVMFVKRNFTVMYKQTILGPLWIILNPLITTVLFNVVFGGIAGLSTDGTPSFLFYMAGNTVWTFFASCINGTANTFVANSQVFGKVYFPRLTTPISQVLTSLINFLCSVLGLLCRDRVRCTPDSLGVCRAAGGAGSHAAGPGCGHYRFRPDHQVP